MPDSPSREIHTRFVPVSRRIDTEGSLVGGRDLREDLHIKLDGDLDSPDPFSYYGTDLFGNRGWFGVFGASGQQHSAGLVPDPGSVSGNTNFLREDGTWALPSGGSGSGDVISDVVTSVDTEIVVFSGTTGKHVKRANTLTGLATLTSGVLTTVTDNSSNWVIGPGSAIDFSYPLYSGTTGKLIQSQNFLTADGAGTLKARHSSSSPNSQASTIEMYSIVGSGSAVNDFGTTLDYYLESSTTNDRQAGRVGVAWQDATDATRTTYMDFWLVNNAALWAEKMRLWANGSLAVGSANQPPTGVVDAFAGFRVNGSATSGTILQAGASGIYASSVPTYPITSGSAGNVLRSNGTNFLSAQLNYSDLTGSVPAVTSISTTSPITGGTITSTGNIGLDVSVDHSFTHTQTITATDLLTGGETVLLNLSHDTSGSPANGMGTRLAFMAQSSTTVDRLQGYLATAWSDVTDATRSAVMKFYVTNSTTITERMRLFPSGGLSVNSTVDPGAGVINANSGYIVGGATSTSGTFLQSGGSGLYAASGYLLPITVGTTGKLMQSNGTNIVMSTPTWPASSSGKSGYTVRDDGTNFGSYPQGICNSSTAAQASSFAADTYITNSNINVIAGDFKAKGQYHVRFDMTKTGAGVATPILTVRIGTNASTADTAILTFTLGAGTAVADTAVFDLWVTFRTVGSGTAATVQGTLMVWHTAATGTGMTSTADKSLTPFTLQNSLGFASNAATQLGVSFNGGTSFSGTIQTVDATLEQP